MRILVVDSDRGSRRLAEIAASCSGYTVISARCIDGAQAELVINPPDLIIASLEVCGKDVLEWGQGVHAMFGAGAPRLWGITNRSQHHIREQARSVGFDVTLVKPFDLVSLLRGLSREKCHEGSNGDQQVWAHTVVREVSLDRRVPAGVLSR